MGIIDRILGRNGQGRKQRDRRTDYAPPVIIDPLFGEAVPRGTEDLYDKPSSSSHHDGSHYDGHDGGSSSSSHHDSSSSSSSDSSSSDGGSGGGGGGD
jgi:hypothetical protein